MSVDPGTTIPAGWYPDPAGSFQQRWWTGTSWTNDFAQYRPTLIHAAPVAQQPTPIAQQLPHEITNPMAATAEASSVVAQSAGTIAASAQMMGGTPAFGATSTLTRDAETRAPQSVAAPFTLPAADQAPQTTVAQPNAGNATLVPVTRVATTYGVADQSTAFSSEYQPFSSVPSVRRGVREKPERRYTRAAWALALSPLLLVGVCYAIAALLPLLYTVFVLGLVAAGFLIAVLLLAVADRRALYLEGHDSTAPPALALLTPVVYLVARAFFVTRETGRGAFAPVILLVGVLAAIAAALVLVPGALPLLASAGGLV